MFARPRISAVKSERRGQGMRSISGRIVMGTASLSLYKDSRVTTNRPPAAPASIRLTHKRRGDAAFLSFCLKGRLQPARLVHVRTSVFLQIESPVLTNASVEALQSGAAVCSGAKRCAALIPRQINFDQYPPTGPIGRAQFTSAEPFRSLLLFSPL